MTEKNTLFVWLVGLVLVLSLINTGAVFSFGNKISAGVSEDELQSAIDGIEFPEYPVVNLSGVEERLDSLELEVAEFSDKDLSEEDEAERLVLDELDSRNFKEDIVEALNLYYNSSHQYVGCYETEDCPVKRYRHITDIVVKDLDVDYESDDENATVTVDLKIYYYIDGDDDETERARINEVVFTVTELDESDDFEDAEVKDWETPLEVSRVY